MNFDHSFGGSKRDTKTGLFKKEVRFNYFGGDLSGRGVYQLSCLESQKIYIGSTVTGNFRKRWSDHIVRLIETPLG